MFILHSNADACSFNLLIVCCWEVFPVHCLDLGFCYLCNMLHLPFCVSAKPFVTAVKGPSREGQSPPEHGLHVLSSDRLCHSYSQQARPARHPAPSLPWSRGRSLAGTPLLIHPVQFHPWQPWGQPHRPWAKSHYTPQLCTTAPIR